MKTNFVQGRGRVTPLARIRYCLTNLYFMNCKILFSAAAIAATTLFASCTQEVDVDANYSTHQTLYADLVEPEEDQDLLSRTSVNVNNPSTTTTTFLWEPGDQIGVYSADDTQRNVMFTNKATKKVSTAQFDGEFNGTPYYAYTPYSANNNGVSLSAVKGTILAEQPYDHETASLTSFYRYGSGRNGNVSSFQFKLLLSMLKLTVDATGTGLEGERLQSIVISVVGKDGSKRKITGDFTFNATNGNYTVTGNTSNQLTMPWPKKPLLSKNKSYVGYANILPDVAAGDKMTFEITTEGHKATFTATISKNYKVATVYGLPLTLKTYKASATKYNYEEVAIARPEMSDFKFEVGKNSGKLLNNELKWNSSKHTPSFSTVSEHKATVDNEKYEIALTIPYLYDFKLKPTFSVGSGVKVTVNGVEQKSGETEVDFTYPVTYTLTNSEGGSRDYTVKVTNTGLPVVVIEHSTSGDFSDEKVGGTNILGIVIGARTVNTFVDFKIRGKDTDWVEDDQITIYNSDGTVDCSVAGGIRHRGNTSRDYPKKPFALKFKDKKSVLGMPAHKRWVLLANWLDHSMIRNTVAFDIAQVVEYAWRQSGGEIGEGIPWSVHGQNVELVVADKDGNYHHVGNYLLCEQIKIDENRLNITSEKGADTGSDYTQYGYLLEVDNTYDEIDKFKTSKSVPFMFKDEVSDKILNDVKTKVQRIETNLYKNTEAGFAAAFEELDINSVIDQMLIWELAMNREYGDPKSVYMYMDKDGKLSAGPVWDFDRGTFQNQEKAKELCDSKGPGSDNYYRIKPDNEWMYWRTQESDTYSYVWYKQLAKSATYQKAVQKRWEVIEPYLNLIPAQIQSYGQALAKSYEYDSKMWPTTKDDIRNYKSDFNDWSGDETLGANGNYQEVINNFITVYNERLAGMDGLITSGKFTK